MSEIVSIRASSAPLAVKCPAALDSPHEHILVEYNDGAAALAGTAVHEFMERAVVEFTKPSSILSEVAAKYELEVDDIAITAFTTLRLYNELLSGHFLNPIREQYLEVTDDRFGIKVTGHIDLLSLQGDMAYICDYKTGRLDADYDDQMRCYALLVFASNPEVQNVYVAMIRPMFGEIDSPHTEEQPHWTRAEIVDEWFPKFADRVKSRTYSPGEHCRFCSVAAGCGAKVQHLKESLEILGPENHIDIDKFRQSLPEDRQARADMLIELKAKAKLLTDHIEKLVGWIKQDVVTDDLLEIEGTSERIYIKEVNKRSIDPEIAYPILQQWVGPQGVIQASKISISQIESQVKENAPRGQKGKEVARLAEELEQHGAVSFRTDQMLCVGKIRR